MRLPLAGMAALFLTAGLLLVAEEKKSHKCPMEKLMCPEHGDCAGACRSFCDRGGEALTALRARTATALQQQTKQDPGPHVSGACKKQDCDDCQALMDSVFGPVLTTKINARFGEMNRTVKHEVRGANGRTTEVTCTFLTGKLCDPCVEGMKAEALEKYEAFGRERTK